MLHSENDLVLGYICVKLSQNSFKHNKVMSGMLVQQNVTLICKAVHELSISSYQII